MTLGLDQRTQARLLAVALLVSVLMAGVLTGAVLTTLMGRRGEPRRAMLGLPMEPRHWPPRLGRPALEGGLRTEVEADVEWIGFGDELSDRLDLTDEQEQRIDSLLAAREPRVDSLMRAMERQLKAVMDSTNATIEAALTPEQRKEFKRYRADRRDFIVRRFDLRRGHPILPHEEFERRLFLRAPEKGPAPPSEPDGEE